jgi:ribosomal protein L37E
MPTCEHCPGVIMEEARPARTFDGRPPTVKTWKCPQCGQLEFDQPSNHVCDHCGYPMSDLEWSLDPVCGRCCRARHTVGTVHTLKRARNR